MVTDLKEIASAVKGEMKESYLKAALAFQKSGDFDVMTAAYAVLDEQQAKTTSERAETAAESERKEREGRDKARDDYGTLLLTGFNANVWTSQLKAALSKIADINPALRFASIQMDIKRSTEGEGDAAKSVIEIGDPRAIMSVSSVGTALGNEGKGRKGLEVIVMIDGAQHTYQSVNAAAQAILNATANTNKETLITLVNKKANHKVVSVGGKTVA